MKRLGTILVLVGSALLIWAAVFWAGQALFNWYELRQFERRRAAAISLESSRHAEKSAPARPPEGSVIGRLDIPRLHVSTIVLEGDSDATMRRGSGHIPETPLPGESGNTGIAAHRDTIFRPLRKIAIGDRIDVTTARGAYEYAVNSTEIVPPDDVAVLRSSHQPELTLVTCYPFYYVGPAPYRFIVHAKRLGAEAPPVRDALRKTAASPSPRS